MIVLKRNKKDLKAAVLDRRICDQADRPATAAETFNTARIKTP
jgi:hypothetical protein